VRELCGSRRRSLRARRGPLQGEARLLLERRQRRLEEHEHLGGTLEGERLDACGNGAEARDEGGLPVAVVCDALGIDASVLAAAVRARAVP
jgi:hypothetical protein